MLGIWHLRLPAGGPLLSVAALRCTETKGKKKHGIPTPGFYKWA